VSTVQILSVVALGIVAAVVYLPSLLPYLKRPVDSLSQIKSVLAIRDGATQPEVRKAATALLEALLK